jgi:hypothetical protein
MDGAAGVRVSNRLATIRADHDCDLLWLYSYPIQAMGRVAALGILSDGHLLPIAGNDEIFRDRRKNSLVQEPR